MAPDVFERLDEAWCQFIQLACVIAGEAIENLTAFARDAKDDDSLVVGIGGAGEQTFVLGAVDELDDAVVLEAETRGGVGNAYGR